jgi:hypothetical protein
LTDALVRECGEDRDACATRVWAAGECLVKVGVPSGAPLTLGRDDHDGWLVLSSGRHDVATYVARVSGTDRQIALAVLAEAGDASV